MSSIMSGSYPGTPKSETACFPNEHRNLDYAFPPLNPGIPLKSVYERAGFEVNRGQQQGIPPRSRNRKSPTGSAHSSSTTESSTRSSSSLSGRPGGLHYSTANSSVTSLGGPTAPISPPLDRDFGAQNYPDPKGNGKRRQISLPRISVVSTKQPYANMALPTPPMSAPTTNGYFPPALVPQSPKSTESFTQSHQSHQSHQLHESSGSGSDEMYHSPYANDAVSRSSMASSVYTSAADPVMDVSPLPSMRNSRVQTNTYLPEQHLNYTPTVPAPSKQKAKKVCRGCDEEIKGKCVSSKDGRVSGKWHRECFNCHSCTEPFDSGEFYVLNDFPYCHHCYHTENNSLCHTCQLGIEGECLETDDPHGRVIRYHVGCLTCFECDMELNDDYYLHNNTPLCHVHAFCLGGAEQTKLEKRRTRLLMLDGDNLL